MVANRFIVLCRDVANHPVPRWNVCAAYRRLNEVPAVLPRDRMAHESSTAFHNPRRIRIIARNCRGRGLAMCGFIGFATADVSSPATGERLAAALATLYRRGPDGNGIIIRDWVGMGHTRLAIIDPTDAADQPMVDASGRYILVYNGEIYNYRELYNRYCVDDRTVNDRSDTAVLLALYKRLGKDCLSHLNGMFAFAIADLERRTLFMARDRFGEKPLYWRTAGREFLFGSELRAPLEH